MIIDDDYRPTDEQMEILELVYKFRFINRKQIQKAMGHKDPRRINAWLKDLVEHKYLGRIYSHKLLENTKPAIYYLDNQGIGWVRANYYEDRPERIKRFYQDKTASERFITHCTNLAEIYTQWIPFKTPAQRRKEKTEEVDEYHFTTSTEMWYEEDVKAIRPDAHMEYWHKETIHTNFLELIELYVPMYAIRYKIDQYIDFVSDTDRWDIYNGGGKYFIVKLIFPNQQKLNRIARYIQNKFNESYDVESLVFMLTTYEKTLAEGVENKNIWKRIEST